MKFTIDIQLGVFLVIVFLISQLLIKPLTNLFKDELTYCGARQVVANGENVHVETTSKAFQALGIHKFVSSKGKILWFLSAIKLVVALFLFTSIALWERTVEAENIQLTIPVTPTAQFDGALRPPEGKTFLMSPFPVIGLTEQQAERLKPFSKSGTDSSEQYKVREDIGMASQYASACIKTPNSTHTVVSTAAVIVDQQGKRRSSCLDGSGTSSVLIAASFKTDPEENGREVKNVKLLRAISTDGVSTVYAAQLTDDQGELYKGYIAITKRSYFNADVGWSFYGLLRKEQEGSEVWRLSLPLERQSKPCLGVETGAWRVTGDDYTCPTGETFFRHNDPSGVETKALQGAELTLNTRQTKGDENSDLLAWMVETDYARFWAAQTFAKELRERVRSDRMFYSAFDGQPVIATSGSTRESVSFGGLETILVAVAVGLLFLQIAVGIIWKRLQVRKYNIRSEIISYEAIAAMYHGEVSGMHTDGGRTQLELGILNGGEESQRLGVVSKSDWTERTWNSSGGLRKGDLDVEYG